MFGVDASAAGRRPGMIALGLIAGVFSASAAFAQAAPAAGQPAAPAAGQPAAQAAAAPTTRLFASDAGMVLNFIKPDKGPDFEAVIAKLKEALAKSEKPERKQQAQSWKVFKSPDPAAGGNLLYVFVIDPAVKEADYTVSNILAEAFPPAEVNDLYKKYAEAYATGQNFVNLSLVADLK
jgi:pyruvate/2-oxoglutarate dehydrogenase complex dihydrolipoamide acyltransferase (E2) component